LIPLFLLAFGLLLATVGPSAAVAQDAAAGLDALVRASHPWGRFQPGAWKKVRVRSETLDENGEVQSASVRETKTTLTEITDQYVTLTFEVTIEVAGKRFDQKPQTVKQGYFGQINGEQADVESTGTESIEVGGQTIQCRTCRAVVSDDGRRRITELTMSADTPPYLLRRRTVSQVAEGRADYETSVQAIGLAMPYRVMAELKTGAFVQTIHRDGGGASITFEVFCEDIPGGVVAHSSKELDTEGKVIRRTALELVDYGVGPQDVPSGGE